MTARQDLVEALQTTGQVSSLLNAGFDALTVTSAALKLLPKMPAHRSTADLVEELRRRVAADYNFAGIVLERLLGDLDPLGEGYTVEPPPSVQLTRYGLITEHTGWGLYRDVRPAGQIAPANTDYRILNNAENNVIDQVPNDIPTFYDGVKITGRSGDGLMGALRMTVTPVDDQATWIEFWIDTLGGIKNFAEIISLPAGQAVGVPVKFVFIGFTRANWETNGGFVTCRSDGEVTLTEVAYTLERTHKARIDA